MPGLQSKLLTFAADHFIISVNYEKFRNKISGGVGGGFGQGVCLCGWESRLVLRYRQTENIPNDLAGGMLIVSNHQTYFDPFWICVPVRRKFRFMAYDKALDWFLIGRLIRYLGAFPVSLNGSGARRVWRESKKSLADGATLVVFPEASRGFSNGELLPFKSGAARLAYDSRVPILPVTIRGANRVWAQDLKFPRLFRRVEIVYHPLYEIPPLPADIELSDFLENQTAKLADIIRSEQQI